MHSAEDLISQTMPNEDRALDQNSHYNDDHTHQLYARTGSPGATTKSNPIQEAGWSPSDYTFLKKLIAGIGQLDLGVPYSQQSAEKLKTLQEQQS
ncbi:hypothetical protein H0H93_002774, partial [Arthromyces matolae]